MSCLQLIFLTPGTTPTLLRLSPLSTPQALCELEHAVVARPSMPRRGLLGTDAAAAPEHRTHCASAAEIEYASWMPDAGAIEFASWAKRLPHCLP